MWHSRKTWLMGMLCVVIVVTTCLVAVRHRHTGDRFHSHAKNSARSAHPAHSHAHHAHAHGHSHSHSHSHGHTHRHSRTECHSHSHNHGHSHGPAHSHHSSAEQTAAATSQHYEGWHIHLFVMGWEITFWEQGVEVVRVSPQAEEWSAEVAQSTTVLQGSELLAPGGYRWSGVSFVLPILLLPLSRVVCPRNDFTSRVADPLLGQGRERERPPLPPPRTAETRIFWS